jgi:hypothetical protein
MDFSDRLSEVDDREVAGFAIYCTYGGSAFTLPPLIEWLKNTQYAVLVCAPLYVHQAGTTQWVSTGPEFQIKN